MSDFDRGVWYGVSITLAAIVVIAIIGMIAEPTPPPGTRLVVLDKRDMLDASDNAPGRMAGSGESGTNT